MLKLHTACLKIKTKPLRNPTTQNKLWEVTKFVHSFLSEQRKRRGFWNIKIKTEDIKIIFYA